MAEHQKNYWAYRVDKSKISFFQKELLNGNLRQGWGWLPEQELPEPKIDQGARRNLPMYNNVKRGDILLIPRLPDWDKVAIVEATEDWNKGYRFEIDRNLKDYGHIFPAKYIKRFARYNEHVKKIRSALIGRSRFWNINNYGKYIEELLEKEQAELEKNQDHKSRLENSIGSVFNEIFNEENFSEKLYSKLIEQFGREEWEYALVHGLRQLFPHYDIQRVGGTSESEHGTDILVRIPGIIPDFEYCIAIQVKDYEGFVASDVITQINKADYWNSDSMKLIEKIVIITKAKEDENLELSNNESGVKFIFASELKQILSKIGQAYIGYKT
jgi:hypothetical protein